MERRAERDWAGGHGGVCGEKPRAVCVRCSGGWRLHNGEKI
jgi:hypothetical protein